MNIVIVDVSPLFQSEQSDKIVLAAFIMPDGFEPLGSLIWSDGEKILKNIYSWRLEASTMS